MMKNYKQNNNHNQSLIMERMCQALIQMNQGMINGGNSNLEDVPAVELGKSIKKIDLGKRGGNGNGDNDDVD